MNIDLFSTEDKIFWNNIISPIIGVIAFIITIVALIYSPAPILITSLLTIPFVFVFYYMIKIFYCFLKKTFNSEVFYFNWNDLPVKYKRNELLKDSTNKKGTIEIIARTANNWFFGDIIKTSKDDPELSSKEMESQILIFALIKSGGCISFFLQDPVKDVYFFDEQGNAQMHRDLFLTIKSYKEMLKKFSFEERKNFRLFLCAEPIISSMVRIKNKTRTTDIFVDLSIASRFPHKNGSAEIKSRRTFAYILHFKSRSEYFSDMNEKFMQVSSQAVPLIHYEMYTIKEKYCVLWKSLSYNRILKLSTYLYLVNSEIDTFEFLSNPNDIKFLDCSDSQCESLKLSTSNKSYVFENKFIYPRCNSCSLPDFIKETIECLKLYGDDHLALEIMKSDEANFNTIWDKR